MIKQGIGFNDILEKKYKILRTSIILGNLNNRDDIFREYEDVARDIDKIKNGVYEEVLAGKMYTTVTLEEEKERLTELIAVINKRIDEKNDFLDDYIKITANFLDDLSPVSGERDLADYEIRLSNINEYLENSRNIEIFNAKLVELRNLLEEKYDNKANNELINSKLEEELIEEFNRVCLKDEYYQNIDYAEIDDELDKLNSNMQEKETVMNTFVSSYEALVNAGISGAEREEYASYVRDARKDYYSDLEKAYILELYKLVLDKEQDYEKLYEKREDINNILSDREQARRNLDIDSRDNLEEFINLCDEQFNIIKSQKYNLEDIDNLILDINNCENKLNELELANQREGIQEILEEYSIEAVHAEKIEMPEEKEIVTYERVIEEENNEVNPSNMVIKIREPLKINVKNASDTAKLVMKKVVIVLEPKKFNNKRDKLKEVEEELEINNNHEKVVSVVKDGKENNHIGIELDTKAVFNDEKVMEVDNLDGLKINTENPDNIKLNTEIFIEEPEEEKIDLFKVTDPFLDDNEVEKERERAEKELNSGMPIISNIGTVKPNSAFAKIQDAVKENDSIILPTLGLTENKKVDVPIVSENYIN